MTVSNLMYIYHNIQGLEYDIYGIFKAFCPEYTIKIMYLEDMIQTIGHENTDTWYIKLTDNLLELYYYESNDKEPLEWKEFCFFAGESNSNLSKKNRLKRYLYEILYKKYQKTLPWGTLTGIRPIKLIASILNETGSYDKTLEISKEEFLISDEKAKLALDIAIRQKNILSMVEGNSYSLYLSLPFCPSICSYCSFPSGVYKASLSFIEDYITCVCKELKIVSEVIGNKPLCIYIGGGTPSVIDRAYLIKIFDCLCNCFDLNQCREITFEAGRPDSMDKELFETLKAYPVTRLSINPQTMNDNTLNSIGRKHDSKDILRAFEQAAFYGYDNINSDIIIGLPNEGEEELNYTLNELLKLPVKSLTVHSLSVKKGSRLKQSLDSYRYIINKNMDRLNELCMDKIKENNMYPYYLYRQKDIAGNLENIGYAKKGYEGLYNILILEEKHNIIGVGAGAVTKAVNLQENRLTRLPNIKDAKLYIERFDEVIEKKTRLGEIK